MRFTITLVSCALLAMPMRAAAQNGTDTPVPHNQTVSANPFGLILNWLNFEYERKLSDVVTIGASASNLDVNEAAFARGTLFLRYYPQGAALTGIYLGARAGVAREHSGGGSRSQRLFATGLEIGRSWLLGSKRNVGISVGLGMDRFFGAEEDGIRAMPTLRLINVGIAF